MTEWIDVSVSKPETERPVIACVEDGKRRYFARVCWIPKFTVEDNGDYEGDTEYDEEKDEFYWPEGWYEWNESDEVHYLLLGTVTHWTIPELPEQNKAVNE